MLRCSIGQLEEHLRSHLYPENCGETEAKSEINHSARLPSPSLISSPSSHLPYLSIYNPLKASTGSPATIHIRRKRAHQDPQTQEKPAIMDYFEGQCPPNHPTNLTLTPHLSFTRLSAPLLLHINAVQIGPTTQASPSRPRNSQCTM